MERTSGSAMCERISAPLLLQRWMRSALCRLSQSRSAHEPPACVRMNAANPGTWSLSRPAYVESAARILVSLACFEPPKPTCAANISACARLVMTTLCSPIACRYRFETTPNSSSICCTSDASRSLNVEYDTWTVLRGKREHEPSPSNSACKNARLTGAGDCQSHSGTTLCADRWSASSLSRLRLSAVRF